MNKICFVCSSWSSGNGGIETVNREICIGVAKLNPEWEVTCFVEKATRKEVETAKTNEVQLVATDENHLGAFTKVAALQPDVIVGHSHISGSIAKHLAASSSAKWVQFVHHDPEDTETYKEYRIERVRERDERCKREIQSASEADAVVCIGPRLFREFNLKISAVAGIPPKNIHQLNCGYTERTRQFVPDTLEVLSLGRSDSMRVKGLDLVGTIAGLLHSKITGADRIVRFRVRGAKGDADSLEEYLVEKAADADPNNAVRINVLPYSTDPDTLRADFTRSQLMLMPSRAEGFGLVALEALSFGTPVLVSRESGVGELLEVACQELGISQDRFVIAMSPNDRECAVRWADKVVEFWENKELFIEQSERVRGWLAQNASWTAASVSFCGFIDTFVYKECYDPDPVPTLPHDPVSGILVDVPIEYLRQQNPDLMSEFLIKTIGLENYAKGRTHADRGEWKESYYFHLRAFAMWKNLGYSRRISRSLGRLGWVHLALGDRVKCKEYLEASLEESALQGAGNFFWAAQYAFRTAANDIAEEFLERFVRICMEKDIIQPLPEDLSSREASLGFIERFYSRLVEDQRQREPSEEPWSDIGRRELIRANLKINEPNASKLALGNAIVAFDTCGLNSYSAFCRCKLALIEFSQSAADHGEALNCLERAKENLDKVSQKFGQQADVLTCYQFSIEANIACLQKLAGLDESSADSFPQEVAKMMPDTKLLKEEPYKSVVEEIIRATVEVDVLVRCGKLLGATDRLWKMLPDLEGFYWPLLGNILVRELTLGRIK